MHFLQSRLRFLCRAGPRLWGWPVGVALAVLFLAGPSREAVFLGLAWLVHVACIAHPVLRTGLRPAGITPTAPVAEPAWRAVALVVDDHPVNLLLARDLLERQGVRAVTASCGPQAIELARRERFDIFFLDVQMPEMDGMQVCQALHALLEPDCPPVIALTAHAFPHERDRFLAAGMDECLTKPVNGTHLADCLDRWLQVATFRRRNDSPHAPAAIDREACVRLAGGKPELARELVTGLVDTLPANLAAIHGAARERDSRQLRRQLHRLLGACRYAGVPGLLEETSRLHEDCAEGQLPDSQQATALHREGLRVLQEAYAWLGSPTAVSMITKASA